MKFVTGVLCAIAVVCAGAVRASPATASNAVTEWAAIVQPAVHNASAPRSPGSSEVLHAAIHLAVYDAVVAIEGGYESYASEIRAWHGGDVRAAVATAAYQAARGRVASSQFVYLDQRYAEYLAGIANGPAKVEGIRVGWIAARGVLKLRENDGYDNVVAYECSANPPPTGEFHPNAGCPALPTDPQPVDVRLGQVRPYTFRNPARFEPDGPAALRSKTYAKDFVETRDYGRVDSVLRTPEQTDVVYFWSEHTYVHWNRNLIALAIQRGLGVRETARLFAMVHTAAADAIITGFAAKYTYAFWRPRTAIPLADMDGNRLTDADPTWTPLLTVNHPEYPSAHAFWSTAVLDVIAVFFRSNRFTWTLVTSQTAVPQIVQAERTYENLKAITQEIDDARVWAGLHWRHSMHDGNELGHKVARHVVEHFFRRAR